jgi:hypothetical protein
VTDLTLFFPFATKLSALYDSLLVLRGSQAMPNVPSIDLATAPMNLAGVSRPIEQFTVAELKDELLRRGNVDFSKWEVAIKLSPFLVLFAAVAIWKAKLTLGCLFQ